MWKIALENAKLIISTVLIFVSLIAGSWTLVTEFFVTRLEATEIYEKLDIDIAYNKAFRLESKISALTEIKDIRQLSDEENKSLQRYQRDLIRVDEHIDALENKVYNK